MEEHTIENRARGAAVSRRCRFSRLWPSSRTYVPIIVRRIGSAQVFNKVTVKSRIAGNIVRVSVTEGQYVHQGDLLIEVDPRPYQARLQQEVPNKTKDQANLENAQRDLPRYSAIVSNQLPVTRQQ